MTTISLKYFSRAATVLVLLYRLAVTAWEAIRTNGRECRVAPEYRCRGTPSTGKSHPHLRGTHVGQLFSLILRALRSDRQSPNSYDIISMSIKVYFRQTNPLENISDMFSSPYLNTLSRSGRGYFLQLCIRVLFLPNPLTDARAMSTECERHSVRRWRASFYSVAEFSLKSASPSDRPPFSHYLQKQQHQQKQQRPYC